MRNHYSTAIQTAIIFGLIFICLFVASTLHAQETAKVVAFTNGGPVVYTPTGRTNVNVTTYCQHNNCTSKADVSAETTSAAPDDLLTVEFANGVRTVLAIPRTSPRSFGRIFLQTMKGAMPGAVVTFGSDKYGRTVTLEGKTYHLGKRTTPGICFYEHPETADKNAYTSAEPCR